MTDHPPRCPSCAQDMPEVAWNVQGPVAGPAPGVYALVVFFCPQCHAVINCQLLRTEREPRLPGAPVPATFDMGLKR